MKKLRKYLQNLDNDQKAVLKSVGLITAIVAISSIFINPYVSFAVIPLQMIVTRLFSNKELKITKKYVFDKKSNKKFSNSHLGWLVLSWFILTVVSSFTAALQNNTTIIPFIMLLPLFVTRGVAFWLKLPVSALLLSSCPDAPVTEQMRAAKANDWFEKQKKENDMYTCPTWKAFPGNIHHDR